MDRLAYRIITAFLVFTAAVIGQVASISEAAGASKTGRLAVSANIANIRSGPGTKYDVLWQVEKFSP